MKSLWLGSLLITFFKDPHVSVFINKNPRIGQIECKASFRHAYVYRGAFESCTARNSLWLVVPFGNAKNLDREHLSC